MNRVPLAVAAPCKVHVTYVLLQPALRSSFSLKDYALLSDVERERHARFLRDQDRNAFLAAHVLLRKELSQHANVPPEERRFRNSDSGRPEIVEPSTLQQLRFNISHTPYLVACVVGVEREVGIDVEYVRDGPFVERVADRHFSPRERKALSHVAPESRPGVFFDYWTLKEAYIKACGLGLALPLEEFEFDLSPTGEPTISFRDIRNDGRDWQFTLHCPAPNLRLAVAARRQPESVVQFEIHRR
jgi:4'-phosphopantetheinyl transferase